MISHDDSFWMRMAIDLANEGKTPFGAVLVDEEGQQVGAFNTTINDGPTAHAEMNVIKKMYKLDYDHAEALTLYTTVEPCPMCTGAIIWAEIGTLCYGASIKDASSYLPQIDVPSRDIIAASGKNITIRKYIEQDACIELLKNFSKNESH